MKEKIKIILKAIILFSILLFLGPLALMPPDKFWGIGEILRIVFAIVGFLTIFKWIAGKGEVVEKED